MNFSVKDAVSFTKFITACVEVVWFQILTPVFDYEYRKDALTCQFTEVLNNGKHLNSLKGFSNEVTANICSLSFSLDVLVSGSLSSDKMISNFSL